MSGYPIETVSRPYRYKKTKKQTKTVEADLDLDQKEKEDLREQNAILADRQTVEIADTSQRLGMKASRLLTRQRSWQLRFPERRRAHDAVRQALLKGVLIKKPCSDCGSTQHVDAHHEDYGAPLNVVWLCRRHHVARHRKPIIKGPNK